MQYKIGQTLILKHETEIETVLGRKIKVPAGNKIIIGADKMAHPLTNGMIQPVSKDIEIKGYDAYGLAKYLLTHIKNWCPNSIHHLLSQKVSMFTTKSHMRTYSF